MSTSAIKIDAKLCCKDAICVNICPVGIFQGSVGSLPVVDENMASNCIKCGHCSSACPTDAISIPGLATADYQKLSTTMPDLQSFRDLVMGRRSIREFKEQPVDLELINELLEITRFCPTAKNTQLLHWVLVNGAKKVRELSAAVIDTFRSNEKMAPMVQAFDRGADPINRGAPQVLLVCGPVKYDWGALDAAIAIANFELAAKASGLGTCWAGFTTRAAQVGPAVNACIGLGVNDKVFAAVMLGHPVYEYCRVPPRKPLELKIV